MSDSLFANPIDPAWVPMSAAISMCGMYRWELTRRWDVTLPCLYWVMLNPSKADALKDDPTIRKCVGFSKLNGFGSIVVMNLSSYRATDPKELIDRVGFVDTIGRETDAYLAAIPRGETVVCAWGSFPEAQPRLFHRIAAVKKLLTGCKLKCVKITRTQPWHPLYVPYGPLVDLP